MSVEMSKNVHLIATILVIVGALNWLSVGVLNMNPVHDVVGVEHSNKVYTLVGVAGIFLAVHLAMNAIKA
jgi:uncharacterized membrane protein YuzA (DUF378 family)